MMTKNYSQNSVALDHVVDENTVENTRISSVSMMPSFENASIGTLLAFPENKMYEVYPSHCSKELLEAINPTSRSAGVSLYKDVCMMCDPSLTILPPTCTRRSLLDSCIYTPIGKIDITAIRDQFDVDGYASNYSPKKELLTRISLWLNLPIENVNFILTSADVVVRTDRDAETYTLHSRRLHKFIGTKAPLGKSIFEADQKPYNKVPGDIYVTGSFRSRPKPGNSLPLGYRDSMNRFNVKDLSKHHADKYFLKRVDPLLLRNSFEGYGEVTAEEVEIDPEFVTHIEFDRKTFVKHKKKPVEIPADETSGEFVIYRKPGKALPHQIFRSQKDARNHAAKMFSKMYIKDDEEGTKKKEGLDICSIEDVNRFVQKVDLFVKMVKRRSEPVGLNAFEGCCMALGHTPVALEKAMQRVAFEITDDVLIADTAQWFFDSLSSLATYVAHSVPIDGVSSQQLKYFIGINVNDDFSRQHLRKYPFHKTPAFILDEENLGFIHKVSKTRHSTVFDYKCLILEPLDLFPSQIWKRFKKLRERHHLARVLNLRGVRPVKGRDTATGKVVEAFSMYDLIHGTLPDDIISTLRDMGHEIADDIEEHGAYLSTSHKITLDESILQRIDQVTGTLESVANRVSNTNHTVSVDDEVLRRIDRTNDTVDSVSSRIDGCLGLLTRKFGEAGTMIQNFIKYVNEVWNKICNLYKSFMRHAESAIVAMVKIFMISLLGYVLHDAVTKSGKVKSFFSLIVRFCFGIELFAEGDDGDDGDTIEHSGNDSSLVFTTNTVNGISNMVSNVILNGLWKKQKNGKKDLPKDADESWSTVIKGVVDDAKDRMNGVSGVLAEELTKLATNWAVSNAIQWSIKVFTMVWNTHVCSVVGKAYKFNYGKDEELTSYLDECVSIHMQVYDKDILKDTLWKNRTSERGTFLYNQLCYYEEVYKHEIALVTLVRQRKQDLVCLFRHLGVNDLAKQQQRIEPICVTLVSKPGRGKSALSEYIIRAIMTYAARKNYPSDLEVHLGRPQSEFIHWQSQEKFWDEYKNQTVTAMDDWGALIQKPGDENQIQQLINMVSTNPYPLTCGRAENKGKIYFNSRLVFLTTNIGSQSFFSNVLACPEAISRRMQYMLDMRITPGHRYEANNGMLNYAEVKKDLTTLGCPDWSGIQFAKATLGKTSLEYDGGQAIYKNAHEIMREVGLDLRSRIAGINNSNIAINYANLVHPDFLDDEGVEIPDLELHSGEIKVCDDDTFDDCQEAQPEEVLTVLCENAPEVSNLEFINKPLEVNIIDGNKCSQDSLVSVVRKLINEAGDYCEKVVVTLRIFESFNSYLSNCWNFVCGCIRHIKDVSNIVDVPLFNSISGSMFSGVSDTINKAKSAIDGGLKMLSRKFKKVWVDNGYFDVFKIMDEGYDKMSFVELLLVTVCTLSLFRGLLLIIVDFINPVRRKVEKATVEHVRNPVHAQVPKGLAIKRKNLFNDDFLCQLTQKNTHLYSEEVIYLLMQLYFGPSKGRVSLPWGVVSHLQRVFGLECKPGHIWEEESDNASDESECKAIYRSSFFRDRALLQAKEDVYNKEDIIDVNCTRELLRSYNKVAERMWLELHNSNGTLKACEDGRSFEDMPHCIQKCSSNVVRIYAFKGSEAFFIGMGFIVKNNRVMTAKHIYRNVCDNCIRGIYDKVQFVYEVSRDNEHNVNLSPDAFRQAPAASPEFEDYTIMQVNLGYSFADRTGWFIEDSASRKKLGKAEQNDCCVYAQDYQKHPTCDRHILYESKGVLLHNDEKNGKYVSLRGVTTVPGNSGGLVFTTSPLAGGFIFGSVIGYSRSKDCSIAAVVTREEIRRLNEILDRSAQSISSPEPDVLLHARTGILVSDKKPAYALAFNPRSALSKTAIFDRIVGRFGPFEKKAALLCPFGDRVPTVAAMKKFVTGELLEIPFRDAASAVSVATSHMRAAVRAKKLKVLTFEEAVTGVNGDPFIGPVKRGTSWGYPRCTPGYWADRGMDPLTKRDVFGYDQEYTLDHPEALKVQAEVEEYISECKLGVRNRPRYTALFLKDELLKTGKDTRAIAACDFIYFLAFKMLFGDLMGLFIKERIRNGTAIGVNPYTEWQDVADHLSETGNNMFAGDFSAFDASQQPSLLRAIGTELIDMYGDDGYKLARAVMWEEVVNSYCVCNLSDNAHTKDMQCVQWYKSLPSGHPATALVNSIYNMSLFVLCYRDLTKKRMSQFHDDVRMIVLGDDNVLSVNDSIRDEFNQVSVVSAMQKYGMVYTDAFKRTDFEPYVGIDKVTFLKRSFVSAGNDMLCPLEIQSIMKQLCYYRNDKATQTEVFNSVVPCTFVEFAMHGRDFFNEHADWLVDLFCTAYGIRHADSSWDGSLGSSRTMRPTHGGVVDMTVWLADESKKSF